MPDPRSHRILLLAFLVIATFAGGVFGQMDWRKRSPTNGPSARVASAIAYDTHRQRVVLFGGGDNWTVYGDTWEWDGQAWTRRMPKTSPPAFYSHGMVYDSARQRIVLVGTWGVTTVTWEWDGNNWIQCTPATSPPIRAWAGIAYDAARRRVVLFGGCLHPRRGPSTVFNDTWEWDGTNWVQRVPATSPPAFWNGAVMAYDSARKRVVLFAWNQVPQTGVYTWEWDGNNWIPRRPAASPTGRYDHAMAYDRARQRVVLFGGFWQFHLNDTWEWDGTTWTQCTPSTMPPARSHAAMAYDVQRGSILLFGGLDGKGRDDTWEYAPRDLTASAHDISVATGGRVKLSLDAGSAHAGKYYWVLGCIEGQGPRGIPSLKVKLLLNPDPYFWFTTKYPNPLIADSLGALDASGKATATIQVPPLPPGLIGWRFYHAYVVFHTNIDYASTPVPLTLVP